MNAIVTGLLLATVSQLTLTRQPTAPTNNNGELVHTVNGWSPVYPLAYHPYPSMRAIYLWFPAKQPDVSAPAVTYALDWTQPNGSKLLPENTRWNTWNIGDLYWLPTPKHVGVHTVRVTATSGVDSATQTIKFNVSAPASTATPVPILGDADELKSYRYQGGQTYVTVPSKNNAVEFYDKWLGYAATHSIFYSDPAASGGSFDAADYGVPYIGPVGGARSAGYIVPVNGAAQLNSMLSYSMASRLNAYFAWPSQSPSFGSAGTWNIPVEWNRYVADATPVIGAGEGRYQATGQFLATYYQLFNRLNPTLKRRIVKAGHYVPTFHAAVRHSIRGAADYFDPIAHQMVWRVDPARQDYYDPAKFEAFIVAFDQANVMLPVVTLSVLSEDWRKPIEEVHTVDRSIARTWVGHNQTTGLDRERHMRIDARQAVNPNGGIRQIHWKVFGDIGGDAVEVTPLTQTASVVDLTIRFPKGNQPVRVAVVAESDQDVPDCSRFSSPAFLTFSPWSSLAEDRGGDGDNNTSPDAIQNRLIGYTGYNAYDKREYRMYDEQGRLLKKSSGGRGQIRRIYQTLTEGPWTFNEDVYQYDPAGLLLGFNRVYTWGNWSITKRLTHPYTADGLKITGRDASGRVVKAEWWKAMSTLEICSAKGTFDYAPGVRRTAQIDHIVYTPDPLHYADRRYDKPSVKYINVFAPDGTANLYFGTAPTVLKGTARIGANVVDGYLVGATTPKISRPWDGDYATLADVLALVCQSVVQ